MEDMCRLCCTTKFVNNPLFDEENALYLKMELFLPVKVGKGDMLPQKVCNRCSCKVNDLYQFCNVAIEAQDRLRGLLQLDGDIKDSIDLSLTKQELKLPTQVIEKRDSETQTEDVTEPLPRATQFSENNVKDEPKPESPSLIKKEVDTESDHYNINDFVLSDSSDDVSLISLKKKKRGRKPNSNGEPQAKRGRKKKPKLKDWEIIMNALPEGTALTLVDKSKPITLRQVKQEDCKDDVVKLPIKVKKEHIDEDSYQCCVCLIQLYARSDMLQHYRQHVNESEARSEPPAPPPPPAGPAPLRCTRCRKVVGAGEWGPHWARHYERDRRPYRCALCEKTFRDPHQILKHGQTHKPGEEGAEGGAPPDKRFVCDLCPESFVYMRYLLSHRSRAHPEAAARALTLRCAVCARSFAHLNSLRRHLRAHSGERNYLCNVCGKALSSREHLKFHIRIHTGYKPHVCKTCGKGFVKKCNLTLHERVHSGEKPHVCSHCGKAFSQRSTLVIHERYHSGARPYVCGLCGRGFVAKGLLSMHLKTTCI